MWRRRPANTQLAAINYSYTRVLAPFDGRVSAHLVSVGDLVGTQPTKLATIVQIHPIYVTFNVSEQEVIRIRGDALRAGLRGEAIQKIPVEIGLQSETGYPHSGHIDYVAPTVDPSTGTLLARGVLENADSVLLPGYFARVRVPLETGVNALLVPDVALGADQGGRYLLVVGADHVVAQKHVTTGPLRGTLRVIETGLAPDDLVVDRWVAARNAGSDGRADDRHADGCVAMIAKFFIERPVLANVLAILFVLLGGVSLFALPVAQLPDVVPPTVQVTTRYPGASATDVMNTVALPIEQQVNGVQGMLYMQSTSASDGTYSLIVTFAIGTDLNFAQVLVQNRVASAMAALPQAVQAQGVNVQQRSTAILGIVTLTSPDGQYDSLYLSNYAAINLQQEMARLPGVGNVMVFGVGQYAMRVWLDPGLMQARGLTVNDVTSALQQQSAQVTAGQIGAPPAKGQDFQYTLNVAGRLTDVRGVREHHRQDRIGRRGHPDTRHRPRGTGRADLCQAFTSNGKPAAGMAIFQSPGANALTVTKEVRAKMAELARGFPQGLRYDIPFDTTKFVSASIDEVYKTLIEAGVLVLIVILVFLQDIWATLVPATTVPVTIIGAFAAMAALGFTVNLSTLFAIVLAIGIVVDDAIVVVEGAAHYVEAGLSGHDAAIKAMNELFGPIIGITLVLMSVFIPAAFLPGLTGRLYAQFALVIAATALISAINAATLKPTQCALWLRPAVPMEKRNWFYRGFNRVYGGLERWYVRLVGAMTRACRRDGRSGAARHGRRHLRSGAAADRVPAAGRPGLLPDLGATARRASLSRTQAVMAKLQKAVSTVPGVQDVICISGISVLDNSASLSNAGVAYVILKDWSERTSASEGLLGMYKALNAGGRADRGRIAAGRSAARHPGDRQCRRLHHAGGIARRQRRFCEVAVPDPDDRRRTRPASPAWRG